MGRGHVASNIAPQSVNETDQNGLTKALAIGSVDEWRQRGHPLPEETQISFMAFRDISETTLEHYGPSIIYSPVLARNFDCIELAILLETLGFTGTYRAVANDLPKPELIEREVRQLCKRIKFELVQP